MKDSLVFGLSHNQATGNRYVAILYSDYRPETALLYLLARFQMSTLHASSSTTSLHVMCGMCGVCFTYLQINGVETSGDHALRTLGFGD